MGSCDSNCSIRDRVCFFSRLITAVSCLVIAVTVVSDRFDGDPRGSRPDRQVEGPRGPLPQPPAQSN